MLSNLYGDQTTALTIMYKFINAFNNCRATIFSAIRPIFSIISEEQCMIHKRSLETSVLVLSLFCEET